MRILLNIYQFFLLMISILLFFFVKKRKTLVLVDFDFTIALHPMKIQKNGWNLNEAELNKKLVSKLKDSEDMFLFTARGLRTSRSVKNWLRKKKIRCFRHLFLGSTSNKIKFVRILSFFIDEIIWYDDLRDINPYTLIVNDYLVPKLPSNVKLVLIR